jgi:hypothetical protein
MTSSTKSAAIAQVEILRQREQQQREAVVAEFAGDTSAMAAEILRHRPGLGQLAQAIEWMQSGAPFAMIAPGPYWSRYR